VGANIVERILKVEGKSWKEKYYTKRNASDWTLRLLLNASQLQTRTDPSFRWSVWFLTLNGKTIAYQLANEYKEVAYFLKTSYDEQYQALSPGAFIINTAIHELFDKKQNKHIDFLTDFPYLQTWSKKCVLRITITLTKGNISNVLQYILENPLIQRILQFVF